MAFFDCQIVQGGGGLILVVTCNSVYAGATITATDGETTLQATCPSSSPYTVEFKIPNSGSWTISGTASGQTGSVTVVVPDSATLNPPVPTGSTVTPVNDIQIWLHCAAIWDKTYTTINQVLADTSTLLALISSNNAADYMARSTNWASNVCANQTAMGYIGNNDYCADKLLANFTWLNAICNSTYMESVLNVKVPTMTSNTAPSGEAFGSTRYSTNYDYYMLFDNNITTKWSTATNQITNQYIGYKFTNPVCVKEVAITNPNVGEDATRCIKTFEVQYSNDNTSWTDATGVLTNDTTLAKTNKYQIANNITAPYWRVFIVSNNGSTVEVNVVGLQFYGRA